MAPHRQFSVPDLHRTDPTIPEGVARWWTKDENQGQVQALQEAIAKRKLNEGQRADVPYGSVSTRALNFVRSNPGLEETREEDEQWECEEFLGAGAFGQVAKWSKWDAAGRKVDTMAIKQAYFDPARIHDDFIFSHPFLRMLPREALLMCELQKHHCDSILQLRGVKHQPRVHCWRYYLEYCGQGDLFQLTRLYRYLRHCRPGKNDRIPEEFLWYAFHAFAKALYTMNMGQFNDLMTGMPKDKYVLHLDLKPDNVFLADPVDEMPYPAPKVGDWGLAMMTNEGEFDNPESFRGRGTTTWFPPESIEEIGRDWRHHHLFWTPHNHLRPFTAHHNTWALGSIIFSLMRLDESNETLEAALQHINNREALYAANGQNMTPRGTLYSGFTPEYSPQLRDLIWQCLQLDPLRRIHAGDLLNRTAAGLQEAQQNRRRAGLAQPTLYTPQNWRTLVRQQEAEKAQRRANAHIVCPCGELHNNEPIIACSNPTCDRFEHVACIHGPGQRTIHDDHHICRICATADAARDAENEKMSVLALADAANARADAIVRNINRHLRGRSSDNGVRRQNPVDVRMDRVRQRRMEARAQNERDHDWDIVFGQTGSHGNGGAGDNGSGRLRSSKRQREWWEREVTRNRAEKTEGLTGNGKLGLRRQRRRIQDQYQVEYQDPGGAFM